MAQPVNLLELIPAPLVRSRAEGEVVVLLLPRARGFWQSWVCRALRRSEHIHVRLDEYGSCVWRQVDGQRNVAAIGAVLGNSFGEQVDPLFPRLGEFLRSLELTGALRLERAPAGAARAAGVGGAALLLAALASCTPAPPDPPPAPAAVTTEGEWITARGLLFRVPAGWTERSVAPDNPFRVAAYGLPREPGDERDAEAVITHFQGGVGTADANVARWLAQFEDPAGGDCLREQRTEEREDLRLTYVDLAGTFRSAPSMMAPEQAVSWPDHRGVFVLLEGASETWSLKVTGSGATMAAREAEVQDLVASLAPDP